MNIVETFLQKVDKIIAFLDLQNEAESLKTNLLASVYLDLAIKIGLDPRNRDFLTQIASKKAVTVEEIDKNITLAQESLENTGFEVEKAFTESSKSVLESFISKLEPKLPPEKTAELRNLVTS